MDAAIQKKMDEVINSTDISSATFIHVIDAVLERLEGETIPDEKIWREIWIYVFSELGVRVYKSQSTKNP